MNRERGSGQHGALLVSLIAGVLTWGASLGAQGNVGAGPLTVVLPDNEPPRGVLVWGPVRLAPGVQVPQAGWDSNVFDEAVDPKADYVFSVVPDVQIFLRTPAVRLSAYTGVDFTYYKTYTTERSVSDQYRARLDVVASSLRPFFGGGYVSARTKPNGEISVRADRFETEVSGGLAYDWSTTSKFWAGFNQVVTEYRETAAFEGVALDQALNRKGDTYSAGFQTALTPLTTASVIGAYTVDRFQASPSRDAESYTAGAEFIFAPQAVVRGTARAGFKAFRPNDPTVDPYSGLAMAVVLVVPVLDAGRFTVQGLHDIQYSFDQAEAYYIEDTYDLTYTHYVFGNVDVQARGGWSGFDYGHGPGSIPRRDTFTIWSAGVGYNLPNGTRLAVQYEEARRRSPELQERNYDRRRAFFSWKFAL